MIDLKELEKTFSVIGLDRLPYYIDLFIRHNTKLPMKITRDFKSKNWESLANRLHKARGSISFFQAKELEKHFQLLEDRLKEEPVRISSDDIASLLHLYAVFYQELLELKVNFSNLTLSE